MLPKNSYIRLTANVVLFAFLANFWALPMASAQEFRLPAPGQMVPLSPAFSPVVLKGIKLDPKNPLKFNFYVDKGDGGSDLNNETTKLIKFFLASLTIPEQDLWVNLSPYEKDRIIPKEFGHTIMGRDLLAQDYLLKQITASLIYPESELGKKFWDKIYKQAQAKYGTTDIPINTFNKVWIVPEKAVVYENGGTAFVMENHLKVMLEEDYLAMNKHPKSKPNVETPFMASQKEQPKPNVQTPLMASLQNKQTSQIIRDLIIPILEKEVNEGKNFAQLRQVFYSLILATWYKKKIKDSILNKVYSNKNKIKGLEYQPMPTRGHVQIRTTKNVSSSTLPTSQPMNLKAPQGNNQKPTQTPTRGRPLEVPGKRVHVPYKSNKNVSSSTLPTSHPMNVKAPQVNPLNDVELIYNQYLQAFQKGVYNYIKEEQSSISGQTIPRKYFSGGVNALKMEQAMISIGRHQVDLAQIEILQDRMMEAEVDFYLDQAMNNKDNLNAPVVNIQTFLKNNMNKYLKMDWQQLKRKFLGFESFEIIQDKPDLIQMWLTHRGFKALLNEKADILEVTPELIQDVNKGHYILHRWILKDGYLLLLLPNKKKYLRNVGGNIIETGGVSDDAMNTANQNRAMNSETKSIQEWEAFKKQQLQILKESNESQLKDVIVEVTKSIGEFLKVQLMEVNLRFASADESAKQYLIILLNNYQPYSIPESEMVLMKKYQDVLSRTKLSSPLMTHELAHIWVGLVNMYEDIFKKYDLNSKEYKNIWDLRNKLFYEVRAYKFMLGIFEVSDSIEFSGWLFKSIKSFLERLNQFHKELDALQIKDVQFRKAWKEDIEEGFKYSQAVMLRYLAYIDENLADEGQYVNLNLSGALRKIFENLKQQNRYLQRAADFRDHLENIPTDLSIKMVKGDLFLMLNNIVANALAEPYEGRTLEIGFDFKFDGKNILISITDNGKGISPENLAKIKQRISFTTKGDQGNGQGLIAVALKLEEYGGDIDVQSQLNQGTTVTIRLPIIKDDAMKSELPSSDKEMQKIGSITNTELANAIINSSGLRNYLARYNENNDPRAIAKIADFIRRPETLTALQDRLTHLPIDFLTNPKYYQHKMLAEHVKRDFSDFTLRHLFLFPTGGMIDIAQELKGVMDWVSERDEEKRKDFYSYAADLLLTIYLMSQQDEVFLNSDVEDESVFMRRWFGGQKDVGWMAVLNREELEAWDYPRKAPSIVFNRFLTFTDFLLERLLDEDIHQPGYILEQSKVTNAIGKNEKLRKSVRYFLALGEKIELRYDQWREERDQAEFKDQTDLLPLPIQKDEKYQAHVKILSVGLKQADEAMNVSQERLISEVRNTLWGPSYLLTSRNIERIVHEPLRKAAHQFYDLNIMTYMSSAGPSNVGNEAYISILLRSLSKQNLEKAMKLVSVYKGGVLYAPERILFTMPVLNETKQKDVEGFFLDLAKQFKKQRLLGASFPEAQIGDPYFDFDGFKQNYIFSKMTNLYYAYKEHQLKDEESFNKDGVQIYIVKGESAQITKKMISADEAMKSNTETFPKVGGISVMGMPTSKATIEEFMSNVRPEVDIKELVALKAKISSKYLALVERFKNESIKKESPFASSILWTEYHHRVSGFILESSMGVEGRYNFRLRQQIGEDKSILHSISVDFDNKDQLIAFAPGAESELWQRRPGSISIKSQSIPGRMQVIVVNSSLALFKKDMLLLFDDYLEKRKKLIKKLKEAEDVLKGIYNAQKREAKAISRQLTEQQIKNWIKEYKVKISKIKKTLDIFKISFKNLEIMLRDRVFFIQMLDHEEAYPLEGIMSAQEAGFASPLDILKRVDKVYPVIENLLLTGKVPQGLSSNLLELQSFQTKQIEDNSANSRLGTVDDAMNVKPGGINFNTTQMDLQTKIGTGIKNMDNQILDTNSNSSLHLDPAQITSVTFTIHSIKSITNFSQILGLK